MISSGAQVLSLKEQARTARREELTTIAATVPSSVRAPVSTAVRPEPIALSLLRNIMTALACRRRLPVSR
ncbi:hypothetical protein [Streptomyces incarnatus]|uniref:hypothetical protein n=1 Tax=Streptomyces incarnatus TaxID=665007 RepID=UPI001AD7FFD8|nr:hypothetical protein [Streptomyces incarnatus]